jgi:Fic family protein
MFTPRFVISHRLLANIKHINTLVVELNMQHYPEVVLLEMAKNAREISVYASTSIEGNPLPLTEVKRVLKTLPANLRDSEKEVVNYNRALLDLQNTDIPISLTLILNIHRQVMQGLLLQSDCGKLRKKPVVVNDPRTGQAIYWPPDSCDVNPLIQELIDFVSEQRNSIDPLILAGIFHKQMVIIHPFMDGNGRTTRLATKVLLAEMGLDTFNLFSFENFYNQNMTRYFNEVGVRGNYYDLVNEIDFTGWLEYFTEGIIDELLRVQKNLLPAGIDFETRLRPHLEILLNAIRENGMITDHGYAEITHRAKATRTIDFKRLLDSGLIERKGNGKTTYYVLKQK